MTFDRRHVLAQWGGTLPGGEIWSNSLRLCGDGTGPTAPVPTHQEMIDWCTGPAKDAVLAFHQAASSKIGVGAKLTFLKMNVVGTDGRYTDLNTVEYVYAPVASGGTNGSIHPTQVTLAVSTTTEFSRGHAHRGRFYLPLPVTPVDVGTGLIDADVALGVATTAATFIEALADEPGLDLNNGMRVCVMSQRGTGATNVVIGVDVGRALDTQRRRRNALPESYQHAVVDQGTG